MPTANLVHPHEALQSQRPKVPRHFERDEAGFCSGDRVGPQELIGEYRETIDPHGFQPLIERSGLARSFNPRFDKAESLRAIVEMNRRSPFTSVVTGRNSGAEA